MWAIDLEASIEMEYKSMLLAGVPVAFMASVTSEYLESSSSAERELAILRRRDSEFSCDILEWCSSAAHAAIGTRYGRQILRQTYKLRRAGKSSFETSPQINNNDERLQHRDK